MTESPPTQNRLAASSTHAGLPQWSPSTHAHIASVLTAGLTSTLPAFSRCVTPPAPPPSLRTPCLPSVSPATPLPGPPLPPPARAYLLGPASAPSFTQLVGRTKPLPPNCNSIPALALQDTPLCSVQHGRAFSVSQSINIDQAVWEPALFPWPGRRLIRYQWAEKAEWAEWRPELG